MSKSAAVGLLSGLSVVVLTLIIVGIVNLPEAEGAVNAPLRGTTACHQVQVAQDQGYELTGKVQRDVCDLAR